MNFTKMNGLGNDYIFVNGYQSITITKEQIIQLCDRHFGIGGDGLVIAEKSSIADVKMVIYNADGSRAEMCGNALRCMAKFALSERISEKMNLIIETDSGLHHTSILQNGEVCADMGKPFSDYVPIPLRFHRKIFGYSVNIGNPHFVIPMKKFDEYFEKYAAMISKDTKIFPQGTNVEFAEKTENNTVKVRVYERGVGETLACGTGATAVFEIMNHFGKLQSKATIQLKGGELLCQKHKNGKVSVTGKAQINFRGNT